MASPVIIKGNQQGLRFIIAPGAGVSDVVSTVKKGLKNTKKQRTGCPAIRISFEGEILSGSDIEYLRNELRKLGMETYIETYTDKKVTDNPKEHCKYQPLDEGLFLIGNIRRGQIVEAAESVIILGDVEAGARVLSRSNVIILGRQDGYVEAGVDGDASSFVYSLIPGRNI
jgi:septum site-determining protein MinC